MGEAAIEHRLSIILEAPVDIDHKSESTTDSAVQFDSGSSGQRCQLSYVTALGPTASQSRLLSVSITLDI